MGKTFKDQLKRKGLPKSKITWRTDMKALKRELIADLDKKTRQEELLALYECDSIEEVKEKNKRYKEVESEQDYASTTYNLQERQEQDND